MRILSAAAELTGETRTGLVLAAPTERGGEVNKIEHRLWSQVTSNWRGEPLTSREVVVNLISATTTRSGLSVHAELDEGTYPKGVKVSKEEMAAIDPQLEMHEFHGGKVGGWLGVG